MRGEGGGDLENWKKGEGRKGVGPTKLNKTKRQVRGVLTPIDPEKEESLDE